MKKRKIELSINKKIVSRISNSQQSKIIGGESEQCGGTEQCTHGPQEETYYCDPYMTDPEANFLSSIRNCTGFLCCDPSYTCVGQCCTSVDQGSCGGGPGTETY